MVHSEAGGLPASRFPTALAVSAALIVILTILFILRQGGSSDEPGIIMKPTGKVEVDSGAGWDRATIGQELSAGNKVHTGPDATVLIKWHRGTVVLLHPETTIELTRAEMPAKERRLSIGLELAIGHVCIGASPHQDEKLRVVVNTKTMTVQANTSAVFDLRLDEQRASVATVSQGTVSAGPRSGMMLAVTAGQALGIRDPADPLKMRPVSEDEAAGWEKSLELLGKVAGGSGSD